MNRIIHMIALLLTSIFSKGQTDTTIFNSQYYLLEKALIKYEDIKVKGGWKMMPDKNSFLKKGDIVSFYVLLRERLETEGYLVDEMKQEKDSLITGVGRAIKSFQELNGLPVTGVPDKATVATLNIPVQTRIRQIEVNTERWKKLPCDLGSRYLFVNTADFRLKVMEKDTVFMQMKIIVGSTYRRTPIFSSKLTHIIFNPDWYIPSSILKKDVLPQIIADKQYLADKHIRIFKKDDHQKKTEVQPDSIDWKTVSMRTLLPYTFVQDPGKENALGVVKFIFPNNYNVYMHDTPSKELFENPEPTFSSGCIRLSHAMDLALYLLKDDDYWTPQKISSIIEEGETITAFLPSPVNVYIQYFTAWVNEQGAIEFRKDIYRRD